MSHQTARCRVVSPTLCDISLGVFCPQGRFYPGTGFPQEVGTGEGRGFNVNIAWNSGGASDGDYVAAFTAVVLPVAHAFQPELIIISAGFDAAQGNPTPSTATSSPNNARTTARCNPEDSTGAGSMDCAARVMLLPAPWTLHR